ALLGSGFVAEFYMQGLANVQGHRVVANYSRDKKRAKDFASRWAIPEPGTDLGKLIARSDIDLYIIGLPNEAHLPVSLGLSRARKNQVCTKPLARTRKEAKSMLDAARRSDRKSTRLNSSHVKISYAVFCLKKKKTTTKSRI